MSNPADHATASPQPTTAPPANRRWAVIALVISIIFVLACLVGAKLVYDNERLAPVGVAYYPAPHADDDQCSSLITALPEDIGDFTRVPIIDPAPAGVAAFAMDSTTRITVRCGVDMPLQYTELSDTVDTGAITWLEVTDPTPGSDLASYYTTNRFPVVVVTTTGARQQQSTGPLTAVAGAADALSPTEQDTHPVPLSDLPADDTQPMPVCDAVIDALPDTLGGSANYRRVDEATLSRAGVPQPAAAWVSRGLEPVVVRCGVANSPAVVPGATLQQVDDIAWFQDTVLNNGTTSGTWYSQGRDTTVAASVPQPVAATVMLEISQAVAATTGTR
ncbi:DUF3515 domain-containing protein [Corynebacterium mendelii]|uniref:DUF3515 domain-containing protein n=1 Tax=Corynebacterium mendelii TaxID=2765362 RepID=A0A939IVU3_9CORY|nr:DUF3515 domain-containing protein [Corynebacterium mendelii]MBN9644601.1 DUF3515 domain-containing protein [Corynebacterium mendelii]